MRENLPLPVQTLYIIQDHLPFRVKEYIYCKPRRLDLGQFVYLNQITTFFCIIWIFCTDSKIAIYPENIFKDHWNSDCVYIENEPLNTELNPNMMGRVQSFFIESCLFYFSKETICGNTGGLSPLKNHFSLIILVV